MIKLLMLVALGLLLTSTEAVAKAKKHLTCRDAKTGEYVTVSYAKKYPGLTVCTERK